MPPKPTKPGGDVKNPGTSGEGGSAKAPGEPGTPGPGGKPGDGGAKQAPGKPGTPVAGGKPGDGGAKQAPSKPGTPVAGGKPGDGGAQKAPGKPRTLEAGGKPGDGGAKQAPGRPPRTLKAEGKPEPAGAKGTEEPAPERDEITEPTQRSGPSGDSDTDLRSPLPLPGSGVLSHASDDEATVFDSSLEDYSSKKEYRKPAPQSPGPVDVSAQTSAYSCVGCTSVGVSTSDSEDGESDWRGAGVRFSGRPSDPYRPGGSGLYRSWERFDQRYAHADPQAAESPVRNRYSAAYAEQGRQYDSLFKRSSFSRAREPDPQEEYRNFSRLSYSGQESCPPQDYAAYPQEEYRNVSRPPYSGQESRPPQDYAAPQPEQPQNTTRSSNQLRPSMLFPKKYLLVQRTVDGPQQLQDNTDVSSIGTRMSFNGNPFGATSASQPRRDSSTRSPRWVL